MKKTLLFAAIAALTSSAFADSAMDLTIPDSTHNVAPSAAPSAMTSAKPVVAVPTKPLPVVQTRAAVQPAAVSEQVRPVQAVSASTERMTSTHPVGVKVESTNRAVAKTPAAPAAMASSTASEVKPAMSQSAAGTSALAPAADVAASGVQATTGVNPFTGKSLSEEELQRELEASKAKTALLEEQLKQVTLTADIANVPLKKRAEVAKLELPAPPVAASAPVVQKPVKPRKVVKKSPSVEIVAPRMPNVKLAGVVVDNGVASAILDVDGNSSIVTNGGSTPFGPVKVLNATSAMVGGMALHVQDDATIARVHISDPKPVDPKAQMAALPTLPMNGIGGTAANGHPLPPVPLPPPTTAAVPGSAQASGAVVR